jgi:hypothetical protein
MFKAIRCGEGDCIFCQREREGLEVEWEGHSLPPGLMCWTCLKKATRMLSRGNHGSSHRSGRGTDAANVEK